MIVVEAESIANATIYINVESLQVPGPVSQKSREPPCFPRLDKE